MSDFFATDGPFFTFITKAGQVIILNVICILMCIPVITIIPALSAFYYSMIKSVRRERGYVHKEYFRSFKHGLKKGLILSLIYVGLAAAVIVNLYIVDWTNVTYIAIYLLVLIVLTMSFVYIIPVLSRFNMKLKDMIKLSVNMSIKHFPTTLLLVAGLLITAFLQIRVLPMTTILFIPGAWCYISTYPIEKVLKKYMEEIIKAEGNPGGDEDTWYLE